jgi:hypothetical protein
MRVIAGIRLFVVAGILSLSLAGAASAAEVTRFKANGNTASSNSNDGTFVLDFSVQRNDTNSSKPETNFFFNRSTCDSNGCSGTFGFGTIPNSDFNAGAHNAKLNTNLAAVPGYQAFSFTQDFNTGESTQTAITPPGPIIVDWKQIKNNSTKTTGTTVIKSGNLTVRTTGTQFTTSATVTGSFAGSPITGSVGNLGQNTNVNVTIVRE